MKIKNFGTFIKLFLLYLCILYCSTNSSILADNSPDDAMDDETKHPKIKAPSFNNGGVTVSGSQSVELDGKWISLATNIQNGKMVMLQLYGDRVYEFPRQYKVIYRIDPRFIEPQIFVLQFNYTTGNYELINESALLSELSGNDSFGQKASALASIFNNTQLIPVNAGDVVNIQLAQNAPNISNLTPSSLTSGMLDISTASTNLLNKIIYVNSSTICENYKITSTNYGCSSGEYFAVPGNNADGYNLLYGNIADSSLVDAINNNQVLNDNSCKDSADSSPSSSLCYYSQGMGIQISVSDKMIKDMNEKFISLPGANNQPFLRFVSNNGGFLNFNTKFPINGMFESFSPQEMSGWSSLTQASVENQYNSEANKVNFLHLGSYVFDISIGARAAQNNSSVINTRWFIGSMPSSEDAGNVISGSFARFDANDSGTLWVNAKAKNNNLGGTITFQYTAYTGSSKVSNALMNYIANPLSGAFKSLSQLLYAGLSTNLTGLSYIARVVMTLAIVFVGIKLMLASTQVKFFDFVKLAIKFTIVAAIFSNDSWELFYDIFFSVFVNSAAYIIQSLTGVTSSVENIFGFIDPLLSVYANGDLWAIIFIQILNPQTGGTFLGIAAFVAIFRLLVSVLNLIVSFTMGLLAVNILISLAPLFIIFIIFEQTRGIFDGWISALVKYVVAPILSFLFLLLLNQITVDILSNVVVDCVWKEILPIKINATIPFIDWHLSFSIPFFSGLWFYQPDYTGSVTFVSVVTSTFLLVVYSNIIKTSMEYVDSIASVLSTSQSQDPGGKMTAGITGFSEGAFSLASKPFYAAGRGAQYLGSGLKSGLLNSPLLGGSGNPKNKKEEKDGVSENDKDQILARDKSSLGTDEDKTNTESADLQKKP